MQQPAAEHTLKVANVADLAAAPDGELVSMVQEEPMGSGSMAEQAAAICGSLSSEERAVLLEYWGISQEMMLRMVEIACFIDAP